MPFRFRFLSGIEGGEGVYLKKFKPATEELGGAGRGPRPFREQADASGFGKVYRVRTTRTFSRPARDAALGPSRNCRSSSASGCRGMGGAILRSAVSKPIFQPPVK